MSIRRFEDIEGWQLARELTKLVYLVATRGAFAKDFGLRDQITRASGSVMHNIAEGFDGGSNAEFVKFCDIHSGPVLKCKVSFTSHSTKPTFSQDEFEAIYNQAALTHAKVGGFIRYLTKTKN